MKVNKNDLAHSRNMLKTLGKGEWKLDGMEILAFGEMMRWFANLQKNIELELLQEEALEKAKAAELEKLKSQTLEPKVLESPIKSIDIGTNKVSKKRDK